MTVILDSGAIIAAERSDPRFTAFMAAARKRRTPVLVPTVVIAETWRGASTHPMAAKLLGSIDAFPALDVDGARRTGELLALSATAAIVDGTVVTLALRSRPSTIVTSDPRDIAQLLTAAGVSFALHAAKNAANADVVIVDL